MGALRLKAREHRDLGPGFLRSNLAPVPGKARRRLGGEPEGRPGVTVPTRPGPASAKWAVHIVHIEIGFTYFAYFAYYFAYFAYSGQNTLK